MPFFKKSLAGPGYIVLNVIRVLNIIVLLACVAASFVMLVKTFVVSKFFFFDAVSHVITGILSILLIITELPLFRRYIANSWPLLSPSSGFVTLGVVMIILGVSILGNLNKEATSADSLGEAFWRIVIASGILACIIGLVNIFASYMFRHKSLGITARQVRIHGNLASQKVYIPPSASAGSSNYSPALSAKPSTRTMYQKTPTITINPNANINTTAPANSSGNPSRRSFWLNRSTTLPSYHTPLPPNRPQPSAQPIRNISAPINSGAGPAVMTRNNSPVSALSPSTSSSTLRHTNYSLPADNPFIEKDTSSASRRNWHEEEGYAPVVNGVQRPDLAHHPAFTGGRF